MALNALRGKSNRRGVPPEPLSIGETDGDIFNCLVCARPLATGTHRCPGCGTRLVVGVPLARAGLFVSLGLVLGMATGGLVVQAVVAANRPPAAVVPPVASASPSAAASGTPSNAPAPSQAVGIPSLASSSLRQAATLHVRLGTAGTSLSVFLSAEDLDASAVARTLRDIASDAAFGASLTSHIGTWDRASAVSADLATFYERLRATAREGLKASIRNQPAYRAAGEAMLEVLATLPDLDRRTRDLARQANVELPPAAEVP